VIAFYHAAIGLAIRGSGGLPKSRSGFEKRTIATRHVNYRANGGKINLYSSLRLAKKSGATQQVLSI
jgi:hypothetical protein